MSFYLGIDIGTFESKGVIVDGKGRIVAAASTPHKMLVPQPGWAEHRPKQDWWGDFSFICKKLLAQSKLPPGAIRVLLPSFELRLAGGLPFVLDPEPGLERVEIHGPLLEPRLDALQISPPLLDRGEQGVEVALRGRHPCLRVGDDIGRDAESPRNGEPVRAAGYAFDETVCRRQRSGVELERRIHHATLLRGEALERPEMRSGQGERRA